MSPSVPARRPGIVSGAALLLVSGLLGFYGTLPVLPALLLTLALPAAAIAMRALTLPHVRATAPIPALAGLVVGALASPYGLLPELLAGAGGLAFLAWLAEDPARPTGGLARARTTLLVPALALGIAWASSFLLPSHAAPIGVAAALLVGALVTLAMLVARPSAFDREEATTI